MKNWLASTLLKPLDPYKSVRYNLEVGFARLLIMLGAVLVIGAATIINAVLWEVLR